MQYVNDDMDDVFRKAAEGYPLDTTGADWNKVLAGLEGREEPKQPVKKLSVSCRPFLKKENGSS